MNSIPGVLSLKMQLPVRETDHSCPSGVEIKNAWSYFSTTHTLYCEGLNKHVDFTFTYK
jgi:hypothetical protein